MSGRNREVGSLLEKNQYTFDVDLKLTKPQIKQLIEELFQVKVMAVNTHRPSKKETRSRVYDCSQASYHYGQVWPIDTPF